MVTEPADATDFDPVMNMARQSLYRFAALALLDPRAEWWSELCLLRESSLLADAAVLVRGEPLAQATTLAMCERPLENLDPAKVLAKLPLEQSALNEQYESTFGLLVSAACPPYETEYINGKFTFQRSQTLADVSGFYKAFGLQPSDRMPERHDHIVLQLEFMAFLLGLQRQAAQSRREDALPRVEVCRGAQARFLQEHLAWWAPAFARLLAKENPGGFYEAVGVFLAALIAAERSLLGVEAPSGSVRPSSLELPEQCEGCSFSS